MSGLQISAVWNLKRLLAESADDKPLAGVLILAKNTQTKDVDKDSLIKSLY